MSVIAGDVIRKGTESANNDARKWPILPFDVPRDFIISSRLVLTRIILRPLSALSLDDQWERNITTGLFGLV